MKQKKKQAGAASPKVQPKTSAKKKAPAKTKATRKPKAKPKPKRKATPKAGPERKPGPEIPATTLNAQHERFCQLHVSGMTPTAAYRGAFGAKVKGANGNACRLIARDSILRRIAELNAAAARGVVMGKQELLEFYTRAIRTPLNQVTRKSDLCHKAKYTVVAGKEDAAEEIALIEIQTVSKIAAGEQLARMQGWLAPEKVEVAVEDPIKKLLLEIRAGRG